jgi:hypothetical protein
VNWTSVALGASASGLAAIIVWAFLPKGVALEQRAVARDADGNPLYDSWHVVNDGHVAARIRSIRALGLDSDNPAEGVERPWRVVIAPGEDVVMSVGAATSAVIAYRRAGWLGVFERRTLTIHGDA